MGNLFNTGKANYTPLFLACHAARKQQGPCANAS